MCRLLNPLTNSYTATGAIQARKQAAAEYGLGASLFPHPNTGGGAMTGQKPLQGISGKNVGWWNDYRWRNEV
jgi:hypothetical protein